MANGINGGLVLIKKGTYALPETIVGQGDASVAHQGAPIELTNKSTGGWRVNLDGSISTKAIDVDVEVTFNDDTVLAQVLDDAFNGVASSYVIDFIDFYYEGQFTPVVNTESAAKDAAVTIAMQFQSSGEITRTVVTP